MTKLLATGKTRYIGVSNFSPRQMEDLLKASSHPPSVHQMEMHVYLQQNDWLKWHQQHNIHVTAYSPLANLNPTYKDKESSKKSSPPGLLDNQELGKIAEARNCTIPQVSLKWGMSRMTSVIPKSSQVSHIKENYGALECRLEAEDFKPIAKVGKKYLHRFNNPSKSYGVPLFEGLDGT
jgi:alcohol dehydrogenase (NADP+)